MRLALCVWSLAFGEIRIGFRRNNYPEDQPNRPEIALQSRSVANADLSDEASIPTWLRNYIFWPAETLAKSERQTPNAQR
jgi:hypothetical protein